MPAKVPKDILPTAKMSKDILPMAIIPYMEPIAIMPLRNIKCSLPQYSIMKAQCPSQSGTSHLWLVTGWKITLKSCKVAKTLFNESG